VDTEQQAICIYKELLSMLFTAQLQIRKWASNSRKFLTAVPKELHENDISFNAVDNNIYALGVPLPIVFFIRLTIAITLATWQRDSYCLNSLAFLIP